MGNYILNLLKNLKSKQDKEKKSWSYYILIALIYISTVVIVRTILITFVPFGFYADVLSMVLVLVLFFYLHEINTAKKYGQFIVKRKWFCLFLIKQTVRHSHHLYGR